MEIRTTMYDQEEIIYPATVQILRNTVTGEISYGWWYGTPDDCPEVSERNQ